MATIAALSVVPARIGAGDSVVETLQAEWQVRNGGSACCGPYPPMSRWGGVSLGSLKYFRDMGKLAWELG